MLVIYIYRFYIFNPVLYALYNIIKIAKGFLLIIIFLLDYITNNDNK